MSTTDQSWRPAWEPLTPRGVGAFAGASFGRLLLAQLIVAGLVAASVVWLLETAWFPIVREAIHQLPDHGRINAGQLQWDAATPMQLSQNRFLGLAVDLYHSGQLGREAHLQLEFGQEDLRVYSLLGYKVLDYPPDLTAAFNRTELEPWWGAWEPAIAVVVAAVIVASLLLAWAVLASVYCVPVRVISFLENRDLNWAQSWRLAGAAMMPGALFMTAGIVAYTLSWMDLIRLGGVAGLQFVVGWIYLFIAPMFCPRPAVAKKNGANPFAAPDAAKSEPADKKSPDKEKSSDKV